MAAQGSKFVLLMLAVLGLRLAIGFHFYHEGVSKLQDGNFSSAPFLAAARGPLAPWFHSLIDDYHGRIRLCVTPVDVNSDEPLAIDATQTFAIWEELFLAGATEKFNFDAQQRKQAEQLVKQSKAELQQLLDENREAILAWAGGVTRLDGFERDGSRRRVVSEQVESLSDQLDTIRADRRRQAAPWLSQVENIWDNLESGMNEIAGPGLGEADRLQLIRPYREANSPQSFIDRFLPWFDLVVGGLLIIGLFTRIASFAGMIFLLGVVATQPPWLLASADTFYQWIELAGLFVLFAIAAGRFGGLDYFFHRKPEFNGDSP